MGGHIILLSRKVRLIIDRDKRGAFIISHVVTCRQVFSIQTPRLADMFIETLKWVRTGLLNSSPEGRQQPHSSKIVALCFTGAADAESVKSSERAAVNYR